MSVGIGARTPCRLRAELLLQSSPSRCIFVIADRTASRKQLSSVEYVERPLTAGTIG
jgi:hypothetical protein